MTVSDTETTNVRAGYRRARSIVIGVARFLVVLVTTFLGLLAVTFFIGRVVPIDPVLAIVGDRAPTSVVERIREEMGFNLPLWQQFLIYLKQAVTGDFGISVLTTHPVIEDIARVFPATLELATVGTLIGAGLGIPFGVMAAVWRDSIIDQIVRVIGLIGYSVPIFWLGLLSLLVFYAQLKWAAYPGRLDIAYEYTFTPITGLYLIDSAWTGQWDIFWDAWRHNSFARRVARLFLAGIHLAHDAVVHAERIEPGIHRCCPRQGALGSPHHLVPRAEKCSGAPSHRHRPLVRRTARRFGADRDGVLLARHWPVHHQFAAERRHECRPWRHHRHRRGLHRHQSFLRSFVPHA